MDGQDSTQSGFDQKSCEDAVLQVPSGVTRNFHATFRKHLDRMS